LEVAYLDELVLLVGFAMDYAIVTLLGTSAKGEDVRAGYLEVWESQSKKNSKYLAFYRLFLERSAAYGKAIAKVVPGAISPIASEFAGNLGSEGGNAHLLAFSVADNYFYGTVESVGDTLRQAKLLA
jgi:hypothetical protein